MAVFRIPVNVSPLSTPISFCLSPHCLLSLSCELSPISLCCVFVCMCPSLVSVCPLFALSVGLRNVCAADPLSVRCGASADRFGVTHVNQLQRTGQVRLSYQKRLALFFYTQLISPLLTSLFSPHSVPVFVAVYRCRSGIDCRLRRRLQPLLSNSRGASPCLLSFSCAVL